MFKNRAVGEQEAACSRWSTSLPLGGSIVVLTENPRGKNERSMERKCVLETRQLCLTLGWHRRRRNYRLWSSGEPTHDQQVYLQWHYERFCWSLVPAETPIFVCCLPPLWKPFLSRCESCFSGVEAAILASVVACHRHPSAHVVLLPSFFLDSCPVRFFFVNPRERENNFSWCKFFRVHGNYVSDSCSDILRSL